MSSVPEPDGVRVLPVTGMPEVTPLDDPSDGLAQLIVSAADAGGVLPRDGDVLVVSSKILSKARGLRQPLPDDPAAAALAREDLVRQATRRVLAERRTPEGLTRVVHSLAGPVLAAAGVDASNVGGAGGALLLPLDPDDDARDLLLALVRVTGLTRLGLVVSDTAGRPWRQGQTDIALGAAGVLAVQDHREAVDADGRPLRVSVHALADTLAGAADLVKGKDRGVPVALVRGVDPALVPGPAWDGPAAASLVRSGPEDWFGLGRVEAVRAALGAPPGTPAADAVGVPGVVPEEVSERVARARRLALLDPAVAGAVIEDDGPRDGGEDPHPPRLVLRHHDRFVLGLLRGRLEVALAAERLALAPGPAPDAGATAVTVRVVPRDGD